MSSPTRLWAMLRASGKAAVEAALVAAHGSRTVAARALGINRTYLYVLVRRYGITLPPSTYDPHAPRPRARRATQKGA